MPEATSSRRSSAVRRLAFQLVGLWHQGPRPDLKAFTDRAGPLSADALLELVEADQRESWRGGECRPAEAYLAMFPALAAESELVLVLVYREVLLREERGEVPDEDEYLRRYPAQAEGLRLQFELHRALIADPTPLAIFQPPTQEHPAAESPPEPPPPPDVPGYEVLGVLGRGGMGIVYWVWQHRLRRTAALKMLRPDGDEVSAVDLARFRNEARAVARLQHPNIVQVYDIGEHHGAPFITLEYVDGGSLAGHLAASTLDDRRAAALVETLAVAMQHAHNRGIVHRDLKPANVLLTAGGVPKVTDFGLAKVLFGGESARTHPGSVLGTPSYMAPEQALGNARDVGAAADVYALGAILYECLTGRPPFKGATLLETLALVKGSEPLPPRSLRPGCPRDLETICLKCLRKEPARRYASAADLAGDLRCFLEDRPIKARPASLLERGVKLVRRRPAAAALAAFIALAAAGGAAFLVWHNVTLRREVAEAARREALLRTQSQCEGLLRRGDEALHRGDLGQAQSLADLVLEQASTAVEEHTDVRTAAGRLREEASVQIAARDRYREFVRLRDDALFHYPLLTAADVTTHRRDRADACRKALALFGVSEANDGPPAADLRGFPEGLRSEILNGCYELLLVLAEAVARDPAAGDPKAGAAAALRVLDRARRLGVTTRAYHSRRLRYLLQQDDPAAALAEREAGDAVKPSTALDWFLLGEERYRLNDPNLGQHEFANALRLRPDHLWAQYYLALGHVRRKDWAAAQVGLTACLGLPRGTSTVWVYLLRAFAHGEKGEFALAEADFEEAANLKPDGAARYALHVNHGVVLLHDNRLDEAEAELRAAVALRPELYPAHVNLAELRQRQQNWPAAVEHLEAAIRHEPNLAPLYRMLAGAQAKRGDVPAALAALAEALKPRRLGTTNADRADDLVERGRLLSRVGRHADALASLDEALTVNPKHPTADQYRAEALLALGRPAEAAEALDRFLGGVRPSSAEKERVLALRGRAQLRAARGDAVGAIADCTLALRIEPDAATHLRRGVLYLDAGAPRLALPDFDACLRLDADSAAGHAGRAAANLQLGLFREAIRDAGQTRKLATSEDAAPVLLQAAAVLAQTPGKIDADRNLSRRDKDRLIAECTALALDTLRDAMLKTRPDERGRFWRDRVRRNSAFHGLRSHERYQRLERDFAPGA